LESVILPPSSIYDKGKNRIFQPMMPNRVIRLKKSLEFGFIGLPKEKDRLFFALC